MSDMQEFVQTLKQSLNRNDAESLEVPHPKDMKQIMETALSGWVKSEDPADCEKDSSGRPMPSMTAVLGQVRKLEHVDDYGDPVGEPQYIVAHRYSVTSRPSDDVSISRITPVTVKNLRSRFPAAFDQAEKRLRENREELPVAFLDTVPPEVVLIAYVMGIRTIREFAEMGDNMVAAIKSELQNRKHVNRIDSVPTYIERAREKVGLPPVPEQRDEPEAKRKPGRPPKAQAA